MPTSPVPRQEFDIRQPFDSMAADAENSKDDDYAITKPNEKRKLRVNTELANKCGELESDTFLQENRQNRKKARRDFQTQTSIVTREQCNNCLKRLKVVALVVFIIAAVVGLFIGGYYLYSVFTKSSNDIEVQDGSRKYLTTVPSKIIEAISTKATPAFNKTEWHNRVGIAATFERNCYKDDNKHAVQFRIKNEARFERDSVGYNNRSFIVTVTGFYSVHVVISVDARNENETVRFFGCLKFSHRDNECKYRNEQPEFIGYLEILESRIFLEKDQTISVTFSNRKILSRRCITSHLKMRLLHL